MGRTGNGHIGRIPAKDYKMDFEKIKSNWKQLVLIGAGIIVLIAAQVAL